MTLGIWALAVLTSGIVACRAQRFLFITHRRSTSWMDCGALDNPMTLYYSAAHVRKKVYSCQKANE